MDIRLSAENFIHSFFWDVFFVWHRGKYPLVNWEDTISKIYLFLNFST